MLWYRQRKPLVIIGIFLVVVVALVIGAVEFLASIGNLFPKVTGVPCIYEITDDVNGNGKYDQGEQTLSMQGLAIEVTDTQGPNSGRYTSENCTIVPGGNDRTVHLHLIMPAGYRATSPTDLDVNVYSSVHFEDYPPHVTLFVQKVSP